MVGIKIETKRKAHEYNPETLIRIRKIMDTIEAMETFEGIPLIEINSGCVFFHEEIPTKNTPAKSYICKCKEELDEIILKAGRKVS